jgi:colanic acid biosynthesis glycosyl transferase WcaI
MPTEIKQKRVLFIGGNYYPELTGVGKYNGEMIDLLADNGYNCTVITSFPYYPYWKVQKPYAKLSYWYKREMRVLMSNLSNPIEIHRCPQYVPSNPTGLKRILLDFSFGFFSFLKVVQFLLFKDTYDYIITVVPGFPVGLLGVMYKKFRGGKFLYHIQDLQIDAASELKMIKASSVINLLFRVEKFILKNADIVSSISVGMIKMINRKCERDVVFFPNWVDTKTFYPLSEQEKLKEEFNISPLDKVILYSGAIGEKQGLDNLLSIAARFQSSPHLKFVICGTGPYKHLLEIKAREMELSNVIFLPLQPAEKFNHFLNMADVHLVLQKSSMSELVMPSKLNTILSVGGLAIITGSPNSSLYEMVSSNNIGILVNPDNIGELTEAIEAVLLSDNKMIRHNARRYAEENLNIDKIFMRYFKNIV